MFKGATPTIICDRIFDKETYTIQHVPSRLELSDSLQEQVGQQWQAYLEKAHAKGLEPWDGTFYRLENIPEVQSGSNLLALSTIKFSEIRGLTQDTDLTQLPEISRPNHIATASLIHTIDGFFVFGEKNKNSMSQSSIEFIGGGLQPDELVVNSFNDVFSNQIKEMEEEIGIDETMVKSMDGIGIVHSYKYNVIFIFYSRLINTKEEVQRIFDSHVDDEMSGIVFILESELATYLKDKGSYRPLAYDLYAHFNESYLHYKNT